MNNSQERSRDTRKELRLLFPHSYSCGCQGFLLGRLAAMGQAQASESSPRGNSESLEGSAAKEKKGRGSLGGVPQSDENGRTGIGHSWRLGQALATKASDN